MAVHDRQQERTDAAEEEGSAAGRSPSPTGTAGGRRCVGGIVLGACVLSLSGFAVYQRADNGTAPSACGRSRTRSDWSDRTKHSCLSPVLAVLSDEAASGAFGPLKEELDAYGGGSGFSFADLLAVRAGTACGPRALRPPRGWHRIARRAVFGSRSSFPPPADLPEGLPDAQLQRRYGGVGGEGSHRLIEEIERRVAACVVYRGPREAI